MPGAPLRVDTLYLDAPRPQEVLVRTEATGLCRSDWHYISGDQNIGLPAVLGHEIAGIVERVGDDVTRLCVGDRVIATVTQPCCACPWCVSGQPHRCENVARLRERPTPRLVNKRGTEVLTLGGIGAFAEAVILPEAALAKVSPSISPEVACLLGCCVSTGVGAVVHGTHVGPLDNVAVIGCGGVGITAIQASRMAGARKVIAIDVHLEKLELARAFGATDLVLSDDTNVLDHVLAACPQGVNHCFEAVGRPETGELAVSLLAPEGTATILGLMPDNSSMSIDPTALVTSDRHIQGAYMGASRFPSDIDLLTEQYQSGWLDLDTMVTTVLDFEHINEGFNLLGRPTTIRTVLVYPRIP